MTEPSQLSCEEVFERLEAFVDRELSATEMRQVQQHMELCEVCAAEYRFESTIIAGLRERLRRINMPATLASRISAQLAQP